MIGCDLVITRYHKNEILRKFQEFSKIRIFRGKNIIFYRTKATMSYSHK